MSTDHSKRRLAPKVRTAILLGLVALLFYFGFMIVTVLR